MNKLNFTSLHYEPLIKSFVQRTTARSINLGSNEVLVKIKASLLTGKDYFGVNKVKKISLDPVTLGYNEPNFGKTFVGEVIETPGSFGNCKKFKAGDIVCGHVRQGSWANFMICKSDILTRCDANLPTPLQLDFLPALTAYCLVKTQNLIKGSDSVVVTDPYSTIGLYINHFSTHFGLKVINILPKMPASYQDDSIMSLYKEISDNISFISNQELMNDQEMLKQNEEIANLCFMYSNFNYLSYQCLKDFPYIKLMKEHSLILSYNRFNDRKIARQVAQNDKHIKFRNLTLSKLCQTSQSFVDECAVEVTKYFKERIDDRIPFSEHPMSSINSIFETKCYSNIKKRLILDVDL
ncbi:MAG: hypothetical protein MHMPM18_001819 [Marteilia pararefringens]